MEDPMSMIDDTKLSEEQMRSLVERAAILLRFRPVPGSDPEQARKWLRSVAEFLSSAALRQVLKALGVQPPADLAKPVEDQSPVLDHLAQLLDGGEDNPAVIIPVVVEVAYLGLVGYAIYWNVTHHAAEGDPS
jgi:hypothetical protein